MSQNTKKAPKKDFAERLQKLFSLIPIIYENQGISLGKLQKLASYESISEVQKDLSRLLLIGKAPFGPTDFISVHIESNAVYLDFPQGLEQPLDLTSEEWIALGKLIEWKLHFQKSGEKSANFLENIMKRISSVPVAIAGTDLNQAKRLLLNEALFEECQIEFAYKSLASKEPEIRRVDPWALFGKEAQSYLIGFCHTRRDARIFSLLRMEELYLLEAAIEHPCPSDIEEIIKSSVVFQKQPQGMELLLGFAPELQRFVRRLFFTDNVQAKKDLAPNLSKRLPEHWLWARTKVASQIWLYEVLLGLGPNIVILSPDFMRQKFLENFLEQKKNLQF